MHGAASPCYAPGTDREELQDAQDQQEVLEVGARPCSRLRHGVGDHAPGPCLMLLAALSRPWPRGQMAMQARALAGLHGSHRSRCRGSPKKPAC
eukprot:8434146-Heterocapsa_arctica.AAC.1